MNLGIAVVYLVTERNGPLLDLHLGQIEKNTQCPYKIYGSANRLAPQFLPILEQNPKVKVCDCETYEGTHRKRRYEHTFYLEQLIRIAIEDNVTHVAILHVDSFPVRPGWAMELAGRLSDRCVVAAIMRDEKIDQKPMTAGIVFGRDFYLDWHPRLLLNKEERSSDLYERYSQRHPHKTDSGIGYGFMVFTQGLSWYPLLRSNKGGDDSIFW